MSYQIWSRLYHEYDVFTKPVGTSRSSSFHPCNCTRTGCNYSDSMALFVRTENSLGCRKWKRYITSNVVSDVTTQSRCVGLWYQWHAWAEISEYRYFRTQYHNLWGGGHVTVTTCYSFVGGTWAQWDRMCGGDRGNSATRRFETFSMFDELKTAVTTKCVLPQKRQTYQRYWVQGSIVGGPAIRQYKQMSKKGWGESMSTICVGKKSTRNYTRYFLNLVLFNLLYMLYFKMSCVYCC